LLALLAATQAKVATQSDAVNPEAVAAVIAEIDKMPTWPALPWKSTNADRERAQQRATKLEDAALSIANYSSADIREALAQYNNLIRDKKREWDKDRALFIINKFLFDIPEFVAWGSPEMASLRLGGCRFLGDPKAPQATDQVLARWPWFSDEAGRWHFIIERSTLTFRSGPPYDPVTHFDALLATFGRRATTRDGAPGRPDDEVKKQTVRPSEVKGDGPLEQGTRR
jgi:hypothetical protein